MAWADAAAECSLRLVRDPVPVGCCWWCGKNLPPRRRRWCSSECESACMDNHAWTWARFRALRRDKSTCQRCGKKFEDDANIKQVLVGFYYDGRDRVDRWPMEVNHREPRNGQGYEAGCWHHLDGLETLCHDCHLIVTAEQRAARRETAGQEGLWA